jgi:hypothetical protein
MCIQRARRLLLFSVLGVAIADPGLSRDEVIDFSDRMTPTCELIGLVGLPPEGWFNVPIEAPQDDLAGCQMMRTDENEELVGMIRLLSREVPEGTPEETWMPELIGLEAAWLEEMGVVLGDPIWRKEEVAVAGEGFEAGKAIGLAATIEGSEYPQEVHLLAFGTPTIKYLVSLCTPDSTVDAGVHLERNTADMGTVIRTFQYPASD